MGLEMIGVIRKKKGMSIEDLALISGVPISTLSKISAGITKDPKLETVKAIAKALDCSLSDFDDEQPHNSLVKKEPALHEKQTQDVINILIEKGIIERDVPLSSQDMQHLLDYLDSAAETYKKLRQ